MSRKSDKPSNTPRTEVLVWTDAQRGALVEAVLERLAGDGVVLAALGGPSRAGLSELGKALDVAVMDDLRQMRVERPTPVVLLATTENVGRGDVQAALAAGSTVLMVEPPLTEVGPPDATLWTPPVESTSAEGAPGDSAAAAADDKSPPAMGRVMVTPLFRASPGWRAAVEAEALGMLGRLRTVSVSVLGPVELGGVYARLYDAMDVVQHVLGMAESVDASLTGPLSEPPADLRAMTGHLTAHLRYGAASAVMQISDRAAAFERAVTLIGDRGQLQVVDTGFAMTAVLPGDAATGEGDAAGVTASPEGETLRELRVSLDVPHEPADLIAHQWRLLRDRSATIASGDVRQIIATCKAASLSTRTGETESPATLLRLSGQ